MNSPLVGFAIGQFRDFLDASRNYEPYVRRLVQAFNPVAAAGVLRRYTLSIGWDGALYDCDFNQMLGLETNHGTPAQIRASSLEILNRRQIVTGQHCFACTAGSGSSCTGASVK
jgi:hypothetical protein